MLPVESNRFSRLEQKKRGNYTMNEQRTTCNYCHLPVEIGQGVAWERTDGLGFYVHTLCLHALHDHPLTKHNNAKTTQAVTFNATIKNINNKELRCTRDVIKVTRQAIHTTFGELLKFKDGWEYESHAGHLPISEPEFSLDELRTLIYKQ